MLGALALALTPAIPSVWGQVFDGPAVEDSVQLGPDLSVRVDPVRLDDEGRSTATRDVFHPTTAQRHIMSRTGSAVSGAFTNVTRSADPVNLDTLSLRLTLTGHTNQQILITDIQPQIVSRTAPLAGTLFCLPPQSGPPSMNMLFDMDRPFPVARDMRFDDKTTYVAGRQTRDIGLGPPFFEQRSITLHKHDQQVLLIRATTRLHYVSFRLVVTYELGDQEKHTVIDNHGAPFLVTAMLQAPHTYGSVYQMKYGWSVDPVNPATLTAKAGQEPPC